MFRLNNREKLTKKRKDIGRGGDRGGTSGKGHKGQKARSGGGVHLSFEGGQMPLSRRLPRRGFSNVRFKEQVKIVNLQALEAAFAIDELVSQESLRSKGLLKGDRECLIKVLGMGTLSKKLTVHAHAFSKGAQEAIEKAGGKAVVVKE